MTNAIDDFFGAGTDEAGKAIEQAMREHVALWSSRICTEAGVLKLWMMTQTQHGASCELHELELTGLSEWRSRTMPKTITLALDDRLDRLKLYHMVDTIQDSEGGLGGWIYAPNVPESGAPESVTIFND